MSYQKEKNLLLLRKQYQACDEKKDKARINKLDDAIYACEYCDCGYCHTDNAFIHADYCRTKDDKGYCPEGWDYITGKPVHIKVKISIDNDDMFDEFKKKLNEVGKHIHHDFPHRISCRSVTVPVIDDGDINGDIIKESELQRVYKEFMHKNIKHYSMGRHTSYSIGHDELLNFDKTLLIDDDEKDLDRLSLKKLGYASPLSDPTYVDRMIEKYQLPKTSDFDYAHSIDIRSRASGKTITAKMISESFKICNKNEQIYYAGIDYADAESRTVMVMVENKELIDSLKEVGINPEEDYIKALTKPFLAQQREMEKRMTYAAYYGSASPHMKTVVDAFHENEKKELKELKARKVTATEIWGKRNSRMDKYKDDFADMDRQALVGFLDTETTGLKLPRRVKVPECFKTLGEYLKDVSYKHSNHKTETVIVTPSDFRKEELYSKYPLDKVTAPFSMAIDRLWDKRLINGPTGALEVIKNLIRDDDSLYDRDRNILTGDGIAFNFDIESINEKIKNWLDSLEL